MGEISIETKTPWDYWNCNRLSLDTEFKSSGGSGTADQFRNILRVSAYRNLSEVSGAISMDNTLTDASGSGIVNLKFNGGGVVTVVPSTGFDPYFKLVGENIGKIYENGVEVNAQQQEWATVSEWVDFSWKNGGTGTGGDPSITTDYFTDPLILSSLQSRVQTRTSKTDPNSEDYRNRYIVTAERTVENITSITNLVSGLYSLSSITCSVGGNSTTSELTLSSDFYGWFRTSYEIVPYKGIGGKLNTIRYTYSAEGPDWAELDWSL